MRFSKALAIILIAVTLSVPVAVLGNTINENTTPSYENALLISYWGDSIGEGVLGPSPLCERDSYAYYAIIGRDNGYIYKNRAISGHLTGQMLSFIQEPDYDAYMNDTLLRTSDIIHVSILGNDLLQNNPGQMMVDYVYGNTRELDKNVATAAANFAKIVEYVKSVNPDAFLMINTVYNPMYEGSPFINEYYINAMHKAGYDANGIRAVGMELLNRLNGVVRNYLEEHPGTYTIIDVQTEFDRIYREDEERGKSLLFTDGVHPSNEGHAVIAELIQAELEKAGLADGDKALMNYKKLRIAQLKRLYSDSVKTGAASRRIMNAKSMSEVTYEYFRIVDGKLPVYYD